MNQDSPGQPLSAREQAEIWERISGAWGIERDSPWYPTTGAERPPYTAFFDEDDFRTRLPLGELHAILVSHNVSWVWELREQNGVSVLNVEDLDPYYNGSEGYWTAATLDWLIYASHEHTITVSGVWLLPEIVKAIGAANEPNPDPN